MKKAKGHKKHKGGLTNSFKHFIIVKILQENYTQKSYLNKFKIGSFSVCEKLNLFISSSDDNHNEYNKK